MAAPASTAPANPLEEGLEKITGKPPLSKTAGTSPIGYDPGADFRQPQADVIQISGSPGIGATWAEQQAAAQAAASAALQQKQFEYLQTQDVISNLLKQQEAQRAQEQLGLTKQTTAQQLATAQQQMGVAGLGMEQTRQGMQYATTGEARAAQKAQQDYQLNQQAIAKANMDELYRQQTYMDLHYGRSPSQQNAYTAGVEASNAAALGPGYYVPGNTGTTYYGGVNKPASNAQLAPAYMPSPYNYQAPTAPSTGQRYYDMGTRQWVNG